jgi:hypothetical protein
MDRISDNQKTLIVNNVVKACNNIDKLNRTGYNFLYLASGFIAHYDINGFKSHYTHHSLKKDLINNQRYNQWHNFSPKDKDYDYYMDKKEIYNRILASIDR